MAKKPTQQEEEFTEDDAAAAAAAEEEFGMDDFMAAQQAEMAPATPMGPEPAPEVGAWETYVNRATDMYPGGRVLVNALTTLLQRDQGQRARLTPQAKADLQASGEPLPDEAAETSLRDTYRLVRDTRNERTAAGSAQNPIAALGGSATGLVQTIAAPLPKFVPKGQGATMTSRLAAAGKTGAAYGALDGATNGEADTAGGDVLGTLQEAAMGGLYGAGFGLGGGLMGEAVRPLAGALKRLALRQGKQAIQGSSDIGAATRKPLSDDAVEQALKDRAIRPLSTTEATAARIEALAAERGAQYGKILDDLEAQGVKGPEVQALAQRLYARYLEEFPDAVANKQVPNAFKRVATNIEEAALPGPRGVVEGPAKPNLGLRQTEKMKQQLQDTARYDKLNAKPTEEAYQEMASTVRQANEDAIAAAAAAAPEGSELRKLAESFVPAKQVLAKTLEARHFARPGASKAAQRSPVGLMPTLMGLGVSGGNAAGAVAAPVAISFARNRLPSTISSGAYTLSEALRTGTGQSALARVAGDDALQAQLLRYLQQLRDEKDNPNAP